MTNKTITKAVKKLNGLVVEMRETALNPDTSFKDIIVLLKDTHIGIVQVINKLNGYQKYNAQANAQDNDINEVKTMENQTVTVSKELLDQIINKAIQAEGLLKTISQIDISEVAERDLFHYQNTVDLGADLVAEIKDQVMDIQGDIKRG